MKAARVVLPILALLLLAAHFYRAALSPLAALAVAMTGLPFVRRPWAAKALQIVLACGTLEWLRTAWVLAAHRAAMGQPYGRLLAILGAVAALTLAAAFLARARARTPRLPARD